MAGQDQQEMLEVLRREHGIPLEFDERGYCVLEHEDDFEIFIALHEDTGAMTFAGRICLVSTTDPSHLFGELLVQNLTGGLCGPFSFGLDRSKRNVLLTRRLREDDLDAAVVAKTVRELVAGFHAAYGAVTRIQETGESLDDEGAALIEVARSAGDSRSADHAPKPARRRDTIIMP